jgi:hypothetical protein
MVAPGIDERTATVVVCGISVYEMSGRGVMAHMRVPQPEPAASNAAIARVPRTLPMSG